MTVTNTLRIDFGEPAAECRRGEFTAELDLVHCGRTRLQIGYELAGPEGAPLLLVAGGISASRHTVSNADETLDGWWQVQSSTLSRHRLLSIDWVGADGELDRPIDASDQARAFLAAMDALHLETAAAFVGASYGAMAGMHCVALAPNRVRALLAISAAHRPHPFVSAQRALQRQAIELGERLGAPEAGVALARKLAILTYRTPQEFAARFDEPISLEQDRLSVNAEAYLDHMGAQHSARMNAVGYRRLSESIDLHRIDPDTIGVPSTFVAVLSDQLIPAEDVELLARAVPGSRLIQIPSLYGHDAFLKEEEEIAGIISTFLNSLEQQQ